MNKRTALVILSVAAGSAVLVYNFAAYCCGRCTLRGFMTVGPIDVAFFGLALSAVLVMLFLKILHGCRRARHRCRCGAILGADWQFCPDCGTPRH